MPKMQKWIDASKFDIRLMWTGPKENPPPDVSLVEGWPFDPPDEFPGWHMVEFGISDKDEDLYWVLWVRAKTAVKKKRRPRKQKGGAVVTEPSVTTTPPTPAPTPAAAPPTTPAAVRPPRARKPKPTKEKGGRKKSREEVLADARARLEDKQSEVATPPAAE